MITTSQTANAASFKAAPSGGSIWAVPMTPAAAVISRAWRAYKACRAFHLAKAQLMALDVRMLRDIGIDRSEICSVLLDRAHERRKGSLPPSVPLLFRISP
ncbi:MAG: DUF1127 domain-containing protein [Hyphomicrobiaceae bacterium]